jgi:hypothetical protein
MNIERANLGELSHAPRLKELPGDSIVDFACGSRIALAHQPLAEAVYEFRVREPPTAHINRDKQVRAAAGYMTEGTESQWIDLLYGTVFDICIR